MEEERTNKSEELNDKFKNFLADLTGNCFDVAEDIYFDVCNKVEKRLNETNAAERYDLLMRTKLYIFK